MCLYIYQFVWVPRMGFKTSQSFPSSFYMGTQIIRGEYLKFWFLLCMVFESFLFLFWYLSFSYQGSVFPTLLGFDFLGFQAILGYWTLSIPIHLIHLFFYLKKKKKILVHFKFLKWYIDASFCWSNISTSNLILKIFKSNLLVFFGRGMWWTSTSLTSNLGWEHWLRLGVVQRWLHLLPIQSLLILSLKTKIYLLSLWGG